MQKNIFLLSCALCLSLVLVIAKPSFGSECTCAMAHFDTRWRLADGVFSGVVTEVTPVEAYMDAAKDDIPIKVTFDIASVFKTTDGFKNAITANQQFVMYTALAYKTCAGYPFQKGEKYLVYAQQRREGHEYWSLYNFPTGTFGEGGLCGGTQKFSNAKTDLDIIRRMLKMKDDTAQDPSEKGLGLRLKSYFGF
jgi:hypothetical protein